MLAIFSIPTSMLKSVENNNTNLKSVRKHCVNDKEKELENNIDFGATAS